MGSSCTSSTHYTSIMYETDGEWNCKLRQPKNFPQDPKSSLSHEFVRFQHTYTSGTSGLPVCIVENEWLCNGSMQYTEENNGTVLYNGENKPIV